MNQLDGATADGPEIEARAQGVTHLPNERELLDLLVEARVELRQRAAILVAVPAQALHRRLVRRLSLVHFAPEIRFMFASAA